MKIEYETTIEEAVDCHLRLWWLRKSSRVRVTVNILLIPVACLFYSYTTGFDLIKSILFCTLFPPVFGGFLMYAYGPGFRRKIRRHIRESMEGLEFPGHIEYEINSEGVSVKTELNRVEFPWDSIRTIREHKKYIEFYGPAGLIQINREYAPPVQEIIAIREGSKSEKETAL